MAELDIKSVLEAKAHAEATLLSSHKEHDAAIVITVDRSLNMLQQCEEFNINIGYAGKLSVDEIEQAVKTASKMFK